MAVFHSDWSFFKANPRTKYMPLGKDVKIYGEKSLLATESDITTASWTRTIKFFPWVTTFILAISTLLLLLDRGSRNDLGSFASGWSTDLASSREVIEVQKKRFNGSPSFNDNRTMFIPNPDPVKYVGEPSQEIDDNWEKLTWGRYFLITEGEAREAWGDDIEDFWDEQNGGYVAGLDVFHTLHCLNKMRKTLYPEYYGSGETDSNHILHQSHCIEQMRQYIMCSGDMTPIPTKYYPALGRNYVDSDQVHTCRNFEKLRVWMVDRYEGPTAVQPTSLSNARLNVRG